MHSFIPFLVGSLLVLNVLLPFIYYWSFERKGLGSWKETRLRKSGTPKTYAK